MKRLSLSLLSLALAGSLTACGNTNKSQTDFTMALGEDISSFDSASIADGGSIQVIKAATEGLMSHGKNGETINGLAKSVETSKDGKTYTFHLRDAKWSNGTVIKADDFVYGFQRIFKVSGPYIYMFGSAGANIVNADKLMGEALSKKLTDKDLKTLGITAKDDKTVVIKLTKPVPYFKQLMTFTCFRPINRAFALKQGKNYGQNPKAYLSNGPFKLVSWVKGSKAEFEKNNTYYNAKNIKIDHLTINLAQTAQAAAAGYENGKVDMFFPTSSVLDKYKNKKGFSSYNTGFEYYLLPNLKNKALANKNIRQAVSYAINRDDFAKSILKDGSTAATGFVPSGVATSPKKVDFRKDAGDYKVFTYNQAEAQKALNKGLKQLGKKAITLRVLYGTDETLMNQFATYVQNSLSKLKGLKVEVVATTKQDRVSNRQKNGDFDLSCTRWGPDYADPTTYLNLLVSSNGDNYGHYVSKAYDDNMNKAYNTRNVNKRWKALVSAEKVAMNDLAVIPVFNQGGAQMINPKFGGIYTKPMVGTIFNYAYLK